MTPREIIAKAWAITKKERGIRGWGFTSALLRTLLNVKLLIYQGWFAYSYFILKEPIGFFQMEELFFEHLPFGAALTIVIIIFLLIAVELILPHFCTGAVIGLAAKAHMKQEVRGGLVLGIYNFVPILVIHELFTLSGLPTVITVASLIFRYGPEGDFVYFLIVILLILFLFSVFIKVISAFSEEAVVIDKYGPLPAIGRSVKLIISHLGQVVFLFILLFVISLRIIINLIMIILIPGIVIGIGLLLSTFLPHILSYTIGSIIGLAIIVVASYFFAYLTVFKQTVWTITYLELQSLRDLDIITETAASKVETGGNEGEH